MSGEAPTPEQEQTVDQNEAATAPEAEATNNDSISDASGVSDATAADPSQRLQQLEQELQKLTQEHETLQSQYMRIAADFDNFRTRQSRDQDDLRCSWSAPHSARSCRLSTILSARQQLNPEGEEAQALHRSYQGLYKQLVEVLKQQGVARRRWWSGLRSHPP